MNFFTVPGDSEDVWITIVQMMFMHITSPYLLTTAAWGVNHAIIFRLHNMAYKSPYVNALVVALKDFGRHIRFRLKIKKFCTSRWLFTLRSGKDVRASGIRNQQSSAWREQLRSMVSAKQCARLPVLIFRTRWIKTL
jgi:hypothetical protein